MNKKRNSEKSHKTVLTKNYSKFAPKSVSLKCPRLGGVIINLALPIRPTIKIMSFFLSLFICTARRPRFKKKFFLLK
jgi:hypothetical protein